jgi:cysteinyl-tRNA synthetase
MCLGAHYRSHLSFSWEGMDAAQTALNRLRTAVYELGEPGEVDEAAMATFKEHINDDLNVPRALALTWDLVRGDAPAAEKKATVLAFDAVLGLRLATWAPEETEVPEEVMALVEQREAARAEKRWDEADRLRDEVREAGYEIEDTPEGPRVQPEA